MVNMINLWIRGVEFQAEEMLRTSHRKKLNKSESSNVALKFDMEALTEEEILTIKWVQKYYKSDFKLYDETKLVPKQDFGSLDCGLYVMHYMDFLAHEKYVGCEFDETEAIRFKGYLVNRFGRSSKCWRVAK